MNVLIINYDQKLPHVHIYFSAELYYVAMYVANELGISMIELFTLPPLTTWGNLLEYVFCFDLLPIILCSISFDCTLLEFDDWRFCLKYLFESGVMYSWSFWTAISWGAGNWLLFDL